MMNLFFSAVFFFFPYTLVIHHFSSPRSDHRDQSSNHRTRCPLPQRYGPYRPSLRPRTDLFPPWKVGPQCAFTSTPPHFKAFQSQLTVSVISYEVSSFLGLILASLQTPSKPVRPSEPSWNPCSGRAIGAAVVPQI